MSLQIRLLPDDKESIEASRKEIINRAGEFVVRMLDEHLHQPGQPSSGIDQRHALLARDILNGRFWGTLSYVDGRKYVVLGGIYPKAPVETREELAKKNEETRAWAKEHFHNLELEEILNIAVNQALLRPFKTSWSGTRRGHSLLYQDLVEKEGSMFDEAVTDEFRRRLNNGRFWEELPHVNVGTNSGNGIYVVRDVLENHFDHLDVGFAVSHGLELMRYSADSRKLEALGYRYLGEAALDRYIQFLSKIDEHKDISPETIEELLGPYISTVLAWDGDSEEPYHFGGKDSESIKRGKFQDKLQAPVLQKYLKQSPKIKEHVAKILASEINRQTNEYGQYSKFVKTVLDNVPDPKAIMGLMLQQLQTEEGIRFFQECEQHGQGLYHLTPAR